ncbi:MAG: hypothetical protein ACPGDB_01480, partial [Fusobacterium sp.]
MENFGDKWISQNFSSNVYYDKIFTTPSELRYWIIGNKYDRDFSYNRTSSGWEDFIGQSTFDINIDIDRTLMFRQPNNTVETKQAMLEAGKNLTMNLGGTDNGATTTYSGTLENKGIIRANENININAGTVKNITIEEQKNILDRMLVEFRLVIKSGHQTTRMVGPYSQSVKKIDKTVNYVSKNKALISAGGTNTIHAGTVLNTTSLNPSLNRNDLNNVKSYTKQNIQESQKDTGTKEQIIQQQIDEKEVEETKTLDEERIQGVNTIIDPLDSIVIPSGDDGLFVKSKEIELGNIYKPLFETNLEYINQDEFYGSNYVFQKLNLNLDKDMRRLGDNYYETRLVNDMYLKTTGGRKTEDGDIDESSLMKYLLDNSVLAQDKLGLVVGQDLTPEQMAKLDRDIVWYVKEVV